MFKSMLRYYTYKTYRADGWDPRRSLCMMRTAIRLASYNRTFAEVYGRAA